MAVRRNLITIAAACLGTTACSDHVGEQPLVGTDKRSIRVHVYASVDDCAGVGRLSRADCQRAASEAQSKHPKFAEKWASKGPCEELHGATCSSFQGTRGPYWAAAPIGFLMCFVEDGQCGKAVAAPIYHRVDIGGFTGQGGGALELRGRVRGALYEQNVGRKVTAPLPVI